MKARALVLLSALVVCEARAQDGGVVLPDAPKVVALPSGGYFFNEPAFAAVDAEMKRLQGAERLHKAEPSWATPVLVGLVLGVVVGAAVAVPVTLVVSKSGF